MFYLVYRPIPKFFVKQEIKISDLDHMLKVILLKQLFVLKIKLSYDAYVIKCNETIIKFFI